VAAESQAMPCSWHHHSDEGLLTILPPEYAGWSGASSRVVSAFRRNTPSPAPRIASAFRQNDSPSFSISSPADGSTYMIDPTLRREFQTLSLKAVAGSGAIEWTIDGRPVGRAIESVEWSLVPGVHRISARDARGRTAEVTIAVR
jgi:membrane carboxypeptidase/penicillin-binding protein PbpC